MTLRVCIPTAGTGSRLGELTRFVNKSLVSIANRPALSHLIEQFPKDTEFVIALGHKGHLVREFLELAYPDRVFFFAVVDQFEGTGSGLGKSLLQCRPFLQQPFLFLSCDTLVTEPIPQPDENWMGYAQRESLVPYRAVQVLEDHVVAISEKGEGQGPTHQAYIGLAGIHDYAQFWAAMVAGESDAVIAGEAYGLRALSGIKAHAFTWFDTGNAAALEQACSAYQEPGAPNILPKGNEAIWFVDDQVIKYCDDESFISNRVLRALEIADFVPKLSGVTPHMYRYAKVRGSVLSDVVNLPLFERFLTHCATFWEKKLLRVDEETAFRARCMNFYKDKTLDRVGLFYRKWERQDGTETINGIAMPTLSSMFDRLDWNALSHGIPGRFHGDFHFENILWSVSQQSFTFLDWRQDFGGSLSVGDIYYDMAKLLHGLIISHELIANGHYRVAWQSNTIDFDFHRKQMLLACEHRFDAWLQAQGYDARRVKILTALIYLNIAALHHAPYNLLLYALGKSMLHRSLSD